jgi:hypothetical protein
MRKHLAPAFVVLLIFVALYFGAYYAAVERGVFLHHGRWSPFPSYRIGDWTGDDAAVQVFTPAHVVDCRLRSNYWGGGSLTDGTLPAEIQGANLY